jgi:hypothetical protein
MSSAHQPREAFVSQLEDRLRAELRRREPDPGFGWMPRSRLAMAFGVALIVVVSMAAGGGAVAAAYEARLGEQRDALVSTLQQRAAIAQKQLELVRGQMDHVQQRIEVGMEKPHALLDARLKVKKAETELKLIELEIAEVQATGREPRHAVSSPVVSGRDFVIERWRAELALPASALEVQRQRLEQARGRLEIGMAEPKELDEISMHIVELDAAAKAIERKIAIRQSYLMGGMTAAVADLRGLEAETEQRRSALAQRIELSRRQIADLRANVEVGTADPFRVAEAELRLQELQLELTKADYDLLLIRKQLGR